MPPGTSRLVQQLSEPPDALPQSVRPAPEVSQLDPVVVEPVQAPSVQLAVAQVQGLPHCPSEPQICTLPVPAHWLVCGTHAELASPLDPDLPDPESITAESLDPESITAESPDPESLDPESLDPESPTAEPLDPESFAPELLEPDVQPPIPCP